MIKLLIGPERSGAREADVGPMELSEHLLNFYELIDTYEVPNAPNVPNVEKPTQLLEVAKLIQDVLIPFTRKLSEQYVHVATFGKRLSSYDIRTFNYTFDSLFKHNFALLRSTSASVLYLSAQRIHFLEEHNAYLTPFVAVRGEDVSAGFIIHLLDDDKTFALTLKTRPDGKINFIGSFRFLTSHVVITESGDFQKLNEITACVRTSSIRLATSELTDFTTNND